MSVIYEFGVILQPMADYSLERIINYSLNDFQWHFLGQRLNETFEPHRLKSKRELVRAFSNRQFDD